MKGIWLAGGIGTKLGRGDGWRVGDEHKVAVGMDDLPMVGREEFVEGCARHDSVGLHMGEMGDAFFGVFVNAQVFLIGKRENNVTFGTGGADELLEVKFEAVGTGAADEDFGGFFVQEGGECRRDFAVWPGDRGSHCRGH